MVSKDQTIGGIIFTVCVVVAIIYLVTLFYPAWLKPIAAESDVRFWVIAIPVFVAFVAVMAIGAWIGWTMATTPPPKPIEEITSEMEQKKEEPPKEMPKEEMPEPQEETKPPEEPKEEKKPERRRKP
ncbi:MAG TPA: transcriptional regulator [Candidatus Eisenbacteria bacterium]|jgi:predicted DNA-binding transcriptional regulator|nr:transcriptional regulator [Candidatus Eisenbacteria bacterium]